MNKLIVSLMLMLLYAGTAAQYCTPTYTNPCTNSLITQVQTAFGTTNINNTGGCSNGNYQFYPGQVVTRQQGATFDLYIYFGSVNQFCTVWVDWNDDKDFDDLGEFVAQASVSGSSANFTINVPFAAPVGMKRMRIRSSNATIAAGASCTNITSGECEDYNLFVESIQPCSGTPTAGFITPGGPFDICNSKSIYLESYGTTQQNNIGFQWQLSTNGGASWSDITGAIFSTYVVPSGGAPNSLYRMKATCNNNLNFSTTPSVAVNVVGPSYTPLPIYENFENWKSYCDSNDIPFDNNAYIWENKYPVGNNSWRRNDNITNAWSNVNAGAFAITSSLGAHSARYHSTNVTTNADSGALFLYADCSAPGTKTVQFDVYKPMSQGALKVYYNQGAGDVFVGSVTALNNNWVTTTFPLNATSATTIIKFYVTGSNTSRDVGLDNVFVLPSCSGQPNAGNINAPLVCPGKPFVVGLSNNTLAAGLSYLWEYFDGLSWVQIGATTTTPLVNFSVTQNTDVRCTVTCLSSGLSDITPVQTIYLDSFYKCYCSSTATSNSDDMDIIQVKLKQFNPNDTLIYNIQSTQLINSPLILTKYTDYSNLGVGYSVYKDTNIKYSIDVTCNAELNFNGALTNVYIDWDRDGIFHPVLDLVSSGSNAPGTQNLIDTFIAPPYAQPGITGLRIISNSNLAQTIQPCGNFQFGETEDYLINIDLPPCSNPNPGTAIITDTLICANYPIKLYDTTHLTGLSGLSQNWQSSPDGIVWIDIPGATLDTLTQYVSGTAYYRFRQSCFGTDAFSNIVKVALQPSNYCYPLSYAYAEDLDTADVGAFDIGTYHFITGGPHLNNPLATRSRTHYTNTTVLLNNSTTYVSGIYSILRKPVHSDAQVSMFIDFNNNGQYDIPAERIYKGIADITNFYLNGIQVNTPATPVFGQITGMRVVLNNDMSANSAIDNGVGVYASGETEDYLVRFVKLVQGINQLPNISDVQVFPNPVSDKLFVQFKANGVKQLKLQVVSIVGAVLETQESANINGDLSAYFNISNYSKGTYILKVETEDGYLTRRFIVE